MNIELYINGILADLPQRPFVYVLQANNMFDFNTREFSHSDVIYLPTTPTNREIFDFADEPATSNAGAYKRYQVDYYLNGIPIVQKANGVLMGKRGDVYIFDFKDNSRDIYVSLAGKQIKDLPLHELDHYKKLDTINESAIGVHNGTYPDYVYAVADYGGEVSKRLFNKDYINFDYIPPSIKMDWILQKIKELKDPANPYIFESPFFDSPFWKSLYMSVSDVKNIYNKDQQTEIFKGGYMQTYSNDLHFYQGHQEVGFTNTGYIRDLRDNAHKFTIPENGLYRLYFTHNGGKIINSVNTHSTHIFLELKVNNNVVWSDRYDHTEHNTPETIIGQKQPNENFIDLKQGDQVYFHIVKGFTSSQTDARNRIALELNSTFTISKIKEVSIASQMSNLSLLDWFKEVTRMFSLTPMKDDNLKNVQQFYTLSERVNQAPVIDWSDRFIKITEQKYHDLTAYAQVNKFKFSKYNEQSDDQDSNDYNMIFNDQALIIEKEFKSKFFGGIVNGASVNNLELDVFSLFDKEFKEKEITENGQKKKITETTYKGNKNRYHVFQAIPKNGDHNYCLNNGENRAGIFTLPFAKFEPLRWENLINNYYQDLPRLMENLYFLTCEFALLETDIYNFSFYSRIYVDKLGSYFLPNKITFRTDAPAIVEMIKIRNV